MSREDRKATRDAARDARRKKLKEMMIEGSIPVTHVSTGVYALDRKLHGFPFGRCIGMYGLQGTFKSSTIVRVLGEVNKINYDTGLQDLTYENPCGALIIDLEHTFSKDWCQKLGFDEDLDENNVDMIIGGENVGDHVIDAIQSDLYSAIFIDSFESMMPIHIIDSSLEMNEQGRRAQLLAKCFRRWIPELAKAKERNRETPWRIPMIIYTNQAQWKMMQTPPVLMVPGGGSQRFYATVEIMMSQLSQFKDTNEKHGEGKVKGTIVKNKTDTSYTTFEFPMALKDLPNLKMGEVDNVKAIFADIGDYDCMVKLKAGKVEIFGEEYKNQKEFKNKMYDDQEFQRSIWNRMLAEIKRQEAAGDD